LRIATWNIERLRHKNKLQEIVKNCEQVNADIFVLTETDSRVSLNYKTCISTTPPTNKDYYNPTETRVTIYTKYELVECHATYDEHTAVCVELKTEKGNLIVYGTIIGIFGNRYNSFIPDLRCQVKDIEHLAKEKNVCIVGDFNCSFTDNYYFTKDGREVLEDVLTSNEISILTREQLECIDHIAVSNDFITGLSYKIYEWNFDKILSDHKGIIVELK